MPHPILLSNLEISKLGVKLVKCYVLLLFWRNARHKFEQALGVGDGQGSLAFCSPWGCKESDMTEWLNGTELAEVQISPSLNRKMEKCYSCGWYVVLEDKYPCAKYISVKSTWPFSSFCHLKKNKTKPKIKQLFILTVINVSIKALTEASTFLWIIEHNHSFIWCTCLFSYYVSQSQAFNLYDGRNCVFTTYFIASVCHRFWHMPV